MSTIWPTHPDSLAHGLVERLGPSSASAWGRRLAVLVVLIWLGGFAVGFRPALAALTVVGFAAALVGLVRPSLGLLGVGMLCSLDALARVYLMQGGVLRWNTFNYWLLLVMLVAAPTLLRQADPHSRLLQGLILLMVAELLFSPELQTGMLHVLNVVGLFGLVVYIRRAECDAAAWYWLGVVLGLLAALGCLLYYVQQSALNYIDANAFCYFPLTALFAICLTFRFARRQGRAVLLALAAVNSCWIFLSGSRQGVLIAGVCLAFLVACAGTLRYRILVAVCLASVGLAIVGSFSEMRDRSLRRVKSLFDPQLSATERTSGRYDLAVGAWRVFLDHPLGVGTGGYAFHWASLSDRQGISSYARGKEKLAHNAWLRILAENGIPGFLLFAGYVSSFAIAGWRRRSEHLLSVGMLATLGLTVAFLATEFDNKGIWFLAAGATVLLQPRRPPHQTQSSMHVKNTDPA